MADFDALAEALEDSYIPITIFGTAFRVSQSVGASVIRFTPWVCFYDDATKTMKVAATCIEPCFFVGQLHMHQANRVLEVKMKKADPAEEWDRRVRSKLNDDLHQIDYTDDWYIHPRKGLFFNRQYLPTDYQSSLKVRAVGRNGVGERLATSTTHSTSTDRAPTPEETEINERLNQASLDVGCWFMNL